MIRNGLFLSAINLHYIYIEFEHFKVIIFFNIGDSAFLTPIVPIFDLCGAQWVCHYLKMIRNGLFFSAINLYYIYMEFEHFKVIIFFNIDDFVFLTSLFDPF